MKTYKVFKQNRTEPGPASKVAGLQLSKIKGPTLGNMADVKIQGQWQSNPSLFSKAKVKLAGLQNQVNDPESNLNKSVNGKGALSGSPWQSAANAASGLFSGVTESKLKPDDVVGQRQAQVSGAIANAAIHSGNPIAMGVSIAGQALDALGAATGINTDAINDPAAKAAKLSGLTKAANNI